MKIIPVSELTKLTDAFRCVPYAANITARTCLARQDSTFTGGRMKGHKPEQRKAFPECVGCPLGAQVAERLPAVDTVPRCHCGVAVPDAGSRKPLCPEHRPQGVKRRTEFLVRTVPRG